MNHHLGYEKHEVAGYKSGNSLNGTSQETLKSEAGEMTIGVPRDRNGTFEPFERSPCDDHLTSEIALRSGQIDEGLKNEIFRILNLFAGKLPGYIDYGKS